MLYLIHGTDTEASRKKFDSLISSLVKKRADSNLNRFNSLNWNSEEVLALVLGRDLFNDKHILTFSNVFENKEAKEYLIENAKTLAESENIFIIIEDELDQKSLKIFEKYANQVQEFNKKSESKKVSEFNIFAITDALGKRDRRELWVLYQKAQSQGISSEEVFWKLCWQIKTILVAEQSDLKESGLKAFPYSKAKSALRNYSVSELKNMFSSLTKTYHGSRLGLFEFDIELEKFILSI